MDAGPGATHGHQDRPGSRILFGSFSLEKKEFTLLGMAQDEQLLLDMSILLNVWNFFLFFWEMGEKCLFFMDV